MVGMELQKHEVAGIPHEVVRRFAYKHALPLREAFAIFADLQAFLDRAADSVEEPIRAVDEAWHEFILHTWLYETFCKERYGHFVHHRPTSPVSQEGLRPERLDSNCSTHAGKVPKCVDQLASCRSCASECVSSP